MTVPQSLAVKVNNHPQGSDGGGSLKRASSGNIAQSGPVEPGKPEQPNTLRLSLKPIGTGIYPTRIIMMSHRDVRVVDAEINAQKLGETFQLEFTTPAFQSVVQDIPLINPSEKAMVVQAACIGQHFQGPREVSVPAGMAFIVQTMEIILTPSQQCVDPEYDHNHNALLDCTLEKENKAFFCTVFAPFNNFLEVSEAHLLWIQRL